ncbi:MAG: HIT domain-containing protein [Candidatus Woykebacteria bacterium]
MEDCLFCKIINKEIPTEFIYEDREVVVFKDINPKSRVHYLIVPSGHIKSFLDLSSSQYLLLTKLVKVVQRLIGEEKLEGGYQLVFNGGKYQHVPHLHWHLLGD